MGKKHKKVVVLPCSGIGKVYGAVARETAYELVEKLRPGLATTTCLCFLPIKFLRLLGDLVFHVLEIRRGL